MRSEWYDREGKLIEDDLHGVEKLLRDKEYKRVAETTLADGKWVSTVWLGLDHSFDDEGPPLIFETMVFPSRDDLSEIDCARYATEAEAIIGHQGMVREWEKKERT